MRAERTGADNYLVKPFEVADLVRRVEALLINGAIARGLFKVIRSIGPI